jgi:hypothetical protein
MTLTSKKQEQWVTLFMAKENNLQPRIQYPVKSFQNTQKLWESIMIRSTLKKIKNS